MRGFGSVHFSCDEALAASLCCARYPVHGGMRVFCSGVAIFSVAGAAEGVQHVVSAEHVCALQWLPGTHQLLLMGAQQLLLLDADSNPPAVVRSAGMALPEQAGCLALTPNGSLAVLACGDHWKLSMAVHDTRSLRRMSGATVKVKMLALVTSIRAGLQAVVVGFLYSSNSWLFHLRGTTLRASRQLRGLHSVEVSQDGCFLCGIQDQQHVLLDGRSGAILHSLAAPVVALRGGLRPVSIAWAGADELHAGYQDWSDMYTEGSHAIVYSILTYNAGPIWPWEDW